MVAGDFLMTYDDCPDVRSMANKFGFQTALVPMKSTHHAEMNELLIGRDLSWV
jgi:DNA adenine methylase